MPCLLYDLGPSLAFHSPGCDRQYWRYELLYLADPLLQVQQPRDNLHRKKMGVGDPKRSWCVGGISMFRICLASAWVELLLKRWVACLVLSSCGAAESVCLYVFFFFFEDWHNALLYFLSLRVIQTTYERTKRGLFVGLALMKKSPSYLLAMNFPALSPCQPAGPCLVCPICSLSRVKSTGCSANV